MKKITYQEVKYLLCNNVPDFEGKEIYIMGCGNTAQLYQEGLQREGLSEKIVAYCQNDSSYCGMIVFGRECVNPESLRGRNDIIVLVCTPQPNVIKEMNAQLDSLGVEHYLLEEAVLKNHSDEVLEVYDMLYDEKSKDIYANMLWCRLCGKYPEHDLITANQYFCWSDFANCDIGTKFVDCGAYVGDSMERYIWYKDGMVGRITCFEPDPNNFRTMQYRAERLKKEWNLAEKSITLLPYGVSDISSEGVVQEYSVNNGLGSKIMQENSLKGTSIKIVALDDIIDDRIDFLKADIESYEYRMLLGAEKTIKKYNPCLAVSIYHNAVDYYSVPLLVHRMMPKAKIAVRHHSNTLAETVLYAWT